eukprot:scaffold5921_cov123-Isochrysis_galbana.AAC.1
MRREWLSEDRGRSGEGPFLGRPAGKGGGGAQLVGSMPPSSLRRGWVEIYWGVWCEIYPGGTGWWRWWWCPAGGKHITRSVGGRVYWNVWSGPYSGGVGWWRLRWYPASGECGLVLLRMLTFKVGLGGVNADENFVDSPLREDE